MNRKPFKTMNGLFRALQNQKSICASDYAIVRNSGEIVIYNKEGRSISISGVYLEDLLPVLKRCYWLVRYSYQHDRVELVAWKIDERI